MAAMVLPFREKDPNLGKGTNLFLHHKEDLAYLVHHSFVKGGRTVRWTKPTRLPLGNRNGYLVNRTFGLKGRFWSRGKIHPKVTLGGPGFRALSSPSWS